MNSFYDYYQRINTVVIEKYVSNDLVLMAAECSSVPKLALFVSYEDNEYDQIKFIKVYVGGHTVTVHRLEDENDSIGPLIQIDDAEEFRLASQAYYRYPKEEEYYDYR